MSDVTLSLPSSTTPLASSGPVGEARGIGADASAEDAAKAFASLLQDSLKKNSEDPRATLLASLLDDGSDTSDHDADTDLLDALTADPAQIATDLLASGLLLPVASPTIEKISGSSDVQTDDAGTDMSDLGRSTRTPGEDAGLPTATIAAGPAADGEADGKNLPDALLAADTLPGTGQPAAQHADFRAHLNAVQKPATEMAVATPINHPGWADDVGHQITWLADNGNSRAELILTPPHLGRIEISLQIGSDLSTAQFVSASPQVREALEQAIPRLREMLAGSGISLGEANVSGEQRSSEQGGSGQHGSRGRDGAGDSDTLITPAARRGTGLVDLFA